jgi:hypothetical protein
MMGYENHGDPRDREIALLRENVARLEARYADLEDRSDREVRFWKRRLEDMTDYANNLLELVGIENLFSGRRPRPVTAPQGVPHAQ